MHEQSHKSDEEPQKSRWNKDKTGLICLRSTTQATRQLFS